HETCTTPGVLGRRKTAEHSQKGGRDAVARRLRTAAGSEDRGCLVNSGQFEFTRSASTENRAIKQRCLGPVLTPLRSVLSFALAEEDEQSGRNDNCGTDEHYRARHVAKDNEAEDDRPEQQRVLE